MLALPVKKSSSAKSAGKMYTFNIDFVHKDNQMKVVMSVSGVLGNHK